MKRTKNLIMFAALSLLLIGCSTERTTTTVTTQSAPLPPASDPSTPPSPTTTTTTKTTTNEPQSVVGATANAVGTVVLFPFRVVGDTLELIF
jgi:PBP1b-binding outer membrane lipoprotein LpoB